MKSILILINDAPYGTEKAYNGLRIANQIAKDYPEAEVRIFLMADAVGCAMKSQVTPNGYYNIERMVHFSIQKGAKVKLCGTCAQARGIHAHMLIEGAEMGTLAQLTQWVAESEKQLVF
ncbi:MAG: DsrE family protein [Candidatus Competibacteraceae bacterium]|nr:DsrE family protein [Candidatus Competibacteraceae bacterium]